MSIGTRHEIEYLRSIDREFNWDPQLIDEMEERLEALRQLDQCVSEADWHPHATDPAWRPEFPSKKR
jgi:hypothetical protein